MHYGIFLLLLFTTVNLASDTCDPSISVKIGTVNVYVDPDTPNLTSILDYLKNFFGFGKCKSCCSTPGPGTDTTTNPIDTTTNPTGTTTNPTGTTTNPIDTTTNPTKPPGSENIVDKLRKILEKIRRLKSTLQWIIELILYLLGIKIDDDPSNPKPPQIIDDLKEFFDKCKPHIDLILWYIRIICQCDFPPGSSNSTHEPEVAPPKIVLDIKEIIDRMKEILGRGKNLTESICDNNTQIVVVPVKPQPILDAFQIIFGVKENSKHMKRIVITLEMQSKIDAVKKYFGNEITTENSCLHNPPVYMTLDSQKLLNTKTSLCGKPKKPDPAPPNNEKQILNEIKYLIDDMDTRFIHAKNYLDNELESVFGTCFGD